MPPSKEKTRSKFGNTKCGTDVEKKKSGKPATSRCRTDGQCGTMGRRETDRMCELAVPGRGYNAKKKSGRETERYESSEEELRQPKEEGCVLLFSSLRLSPLNKVFVAARVGAVCCLPALAAAAPAAGHPRSTGAGL